MPLKIFKVERTDFVDYDEYDSFVVIAKDKKDALSFHPDGDRMANFENRPAGIFLSWPTSLSEVTVTEIGQANEAETARVVLTSFNAG